MAFGNVENDGLARLLNKQLDDIDNVNQKIELWKKYKSDYEELKKFISMMKDKVRHPYRIPIAGSPLAFVDGHIIHTNELMILLGDNYFALRSAKQGSDLADRRLANIDTMLRKDEEAKAKAESWMEATQVHKIEKEEFVEIIETM